MLTLNTVHKGEIKLFRKWRISHQEYFDRSPCRMWPTLTFDFRNAHYGLNAPMILDDTAQLRTITVSIRRLEVMPARGVEIGEFRAMTGDLGIRQLIGKYHTYILGYERLVLVNPYANITCVEVP